MHPARWQLSHLVTNRRSCIDVSGNLEISGRENLIVRACTVYCAIVHPVRPGFEMEQTTSRIAWTRPELKSVKIATTAIGAKDQVFTAELPPGFTINAGPS